VFEIHLRKRNRDPKSFDLDRLAKESDGFSGAEIEQVVIAALYVAFEHNWDIITEDVSAALKETVPLSRTMREDIAMVRRWAKGRARPASQFGLADIELDGGLDLQPVTHWAGPTGGK
jgi:SpoVK/Ycf46/Vps4 family AAA+-type ATPase